MGSLKVKTVQQISDELAEQPEKDGTLDGLGNMLDTKYVELGSLLLLLMKIGKADPDSNPAMIALATTLLAASG